jgi:integrase
MLRDDLERAGIQSFKPGLGAVVFHSLRMSYCTLLDENGASAKENQQLARHATPEMTMNRYVRTRESRVQAVVEALGESIRPAPASQLNPNGILLASPEMHKAL